VLTPNWRAKAGMSGATMPNPRATVNETAVRMATSRGRPRNGPLGRRGTVTFCQARVAGPAAGLGRGRGLAQLGPVSYWLAASGGSVPSPTQTVVVQPHSGQVMSCCSPGSGSHTTMAAPHCTQVISSGLGSPSWLVMFAR
jgi:hypothetical protein